MISLCQTTERNFYILLRLAAVHSQRSSCCRALCSSHSSNHSKQSADSTETNPSANENTLPSKTVAAAKSEDADDHTKHLADRRKSKLQMTKNLVNQVFEWTKFQTTKDLEANERAHPTYVKNTSTLSIRNEQDSSEEIDMPLEEILPNLKTIANKRLKRAKLEFNDWKKFDWSVMSGCDRTGETLIDFDFKQEDSLEPWRIGCDSDHNLGYSTCQLERSPYGTAVFSGNLCTTVPKSGVLARAGWASIKSKRYQQGIWSTGMKCTYQDRWQHFTHFIIKVRGDGRSYMLNLGCPGHFNNTQGDMYSFALHTHGGPYWQITKIPFSKFYFNVYGRVQDRQLSLRTAGLKVSNIGIAMVDRMDGPFRLEIDWMGVYFDKTHFEENAYEAYELPTKAHYAAMSA